MVGDWICIKVEPSLLGGPIIYEAPAPVGNIEAFDYVKSPAFPHIYGGIPLKSVLATYRYSKSASCMLAVIMIINTIIPTYSRMILFTYTAEKPRFSKLFFSLYNGDLTIIFQLFQNN